MVKDIASNTKDLKNLVVRDTDVYIISYPKSGDTNLHDQPVTCHVKYSVIVKFETSELLRY